MPSSPPELIHVGGEECVQLKYGPWLATVCLTGAQLSSLAFSGLELLDRALAFEEPAPAGRWAGRAPLLFPAVGRQRDGIYAVAAKTYAMPCHGFGSKLPFRLLATTSATEDSSEAALVASALISPQTNYPFDWTLKINFRLSPDGLTVRHEVSNAGSAPMPFAIGNHITLRLPPPAWASGGICSGQITHEHTLTPGSLLSGETVARPEFATPGGLPLSFPSATNGVFGVADGSASTPMAVSIVVQPGNARVTVRHAADLTLCNRNSPATPLFFVFWGDAAEGFICLEPWLGGPDELNSAHCPMVPPGGSAAWTFNVEAEQLW